MKFLTPLLGATLRLFIRELRDTRQTLRDGIDTYRLVNGLPPLYAVEEREPEPAGGPFAPAPIVGNGEFLTLDILEQLAVEAGIRLVPGLDLEGIARERGWVDPDGKLLMLPKGYDGWVLGDTDILSPQFGQGVTGR